MTDEQRMRRRLIPEPRRRHQSIDQILLVGHGSTCLKLTLMKRRLLRSIATRATKRGFEINSEKAATPGGNLTSNIQKSPAVALAT
jgi:hypothetical protein